MGFSGPLPPPQVLERYEKICQGAADRIITMAENQSEHRQSIEKEVIQADVKNSRFGIVCGLIIGMIGIISSVIAAIYDRQLFGGLLGATSLGSLVYAFIYGSKLKAQKKKE